MSKLQSSFPQYLLQPQKNFTQLQVVRNEDKKYRCDYIENGPKSHDDFMKFINRCADSINENLCDLVLLKDL